MGQPTIKEQHLQGFADLQAYWEKLSQLEGALLEFSETAYDFTAEPIERALEKIDSFEPSVSVIGQVKAGKSTLMNALIGEVDLLPSDVNPWTSVITGIHLNSRSRPGDTRALFRFFDAHEWDRLVETGGRLGEMADRAGFEAEANEVRGQVMEMRQSTEARLGDEFHKLLGSSHAFPTLEKDTIDRYICYGDPEDLADGAPEGVYADLTKTADLYVDLPGYPTGLCLRDTPGVNDTFMMREQITLNAISESRVCVIVLSAHQALSTMDMALLRIICAVEAREVLIFVNRIDELPNPPRECKNIRTSIEKTMSRMGIDADIEIMFGSGYWANCAIGGTIEQMMPASRKSLIKWAEEHGVPAQTYEDLAQAAMQASGVPALHRSIATRIVEGPGQFMLRDIKADIDHILQMSETVSAVADRSQGNGNVVDADELRARLRGFREEALAGFDQDAAKEREHLVERMKSAQTAFLDTALDALQSHIDVYGECDSWNHEPTSLRMMMRTAYMSACTHLRRATDVRMQTNGTQVQDILEVDLGIYGGDRPDTLPVQPEGRAPTNLAKTLSLDLHQSWWQKFWKFGGGNKIRDKYASAIMSETTPLIEEILTDYFDPHIAALRETVDEHAKDQTRFVTAILDCMTDQSGGDGTDRKDVA